MSNPVARTKQAFQSIQRLPAWERASRFDLGVQAAALRAEQLQSRARNDPDDRGLLGEALQALELAHAELVAARNELREQADELLATRLERELEWTRYRDLFEGAPLPYLETDLEGVVIEANRRSSALLQVSPARLIGKPIVAFIALPDRRVFRHTLESVVVGAPVASIFVNLHPRGAPDYVPAWIDMTKVVSQDLSETVRWMFVKSRETSANDSADAASFCDAAVLEDGRASSVHVRRAPTVRLGRYVRSRGCRSQPAHGRLRARR